MGIRFRKSINCGGARINLSKSGVGFSVGSKGARITKKAKGGTRITATIPGTGISYISDSAKKKQKHQTKPTTHSNAIQPSNELINHMSTYLEDDELTINYYQEILHLTPNECEVFQFILRHPNLTHFTVRDLSLNGCVVQQRVLTSIYNKGLLNKEDKIFSINNTFLNEHKTQVQNEYQKEEQRLIELKQKRELQHQKRKILWQAVLIAFVLTGFLAPSGWDFIFFIISFIFFKKYPISTLIDFFKKLLYNIYVKRKR